MPDGTLEHPVIFATILTFDPKLRQVAALQISDTVRPSKVSHTIRQCTCPLAFQNGIGPGQAMCLTPSNPPKSPRTRNFSATPGGRSTAAPQSSSYSTRRVSPRLPLCRRPSQAGRARIRKKHGSGSRAISNPPSDWSTTGHWSMAGHATTPMLQPNTSLV